MYATREYQEYYAYELTKTQVVTADINSQVYDLPNFSIPSKLWNQRIMVNIVDRFPLSDRANTPLFPVQQKPFSVHMVVHDVETV